MLRFVQKALICPKSHRFNSFLNTFYKMTSAPFQLFQQFRLLPLQEQIKLSVQINQFLVQHFEKITHEKKDQEEWTLLSKNGLSKAYSDDEPDYS